MDYGPEVDNKSVSVARSPQIIETFRAALSICFVASVFLYFCVQLSCTRAVMQWTIDKYVQSTYLNLFFIYLDSGMYKMKTNALKSARATYRMLIL